MAKRLPKTVEPSQHPKERNLDYPLYINRYIPAWGNPGFAASDRWRYVVQSQPIALVCRETLISLVSGLDWVIEPRDSNKRDELKSEIDYYTKFFENTGDYDYTEIIEWVSKDALDLPFGSGVEIGRKYDAPDGKILWIELLDGGTLYPTNNRDYPVAQYVPAASPNPIYFPAHAINRLYLSPRTRIQEKGWGMAPPEKIYLALELMNRGDFYYANLLLDTPAAGILDLGDMDKLSAEEWVVAWRELLNGIDPYKVPVIYEHEKPVNFIPFTKNPIDLNFTTAMVRYSSILTAGYGLSLSDIGVSTSGNGGETLAGTIRDERRTRRTGVATLKKKLVLFFNRLLPETLQFRFIDLDDELMVSLGRARLATVTSLGAAIDKNILTENESRQQMIADGLVTISIPEKLPKELQDKIDGKNQLAEQAVGNGKDKTAERPNMLGRPVSPSQGGWGEVAAKSVHKSWPVVEVLRTLNTVFVPMMVLSKSLDDLDEHLLSSVSTKLYQFFSSSLDLSEVESVVCEQVITKMDNEISKNIRNLYVKGELEHLDVRLDNLYSKDVLVDVIHNYVDVICRDKVSLYATEELLGVVLDVLRTKTSDEVDILDDYFVDYVLKVVDGSSSYLIDTISFDDIINETLVLD